MSYTAAAEAERIRSTRWQLTLQKQYEGANTMFERGQKLEKIYDGTVVTINTIGSDYIVLDGDFEPNHVVMKNKINSYYKVIADGK